MAASAAQTRLTPEEYIRELPFAGNLRTRHIS